MRATLILVTSLLASAWGATAALAVCPLSSVTVFDSTQSSSQPTAQFSDNHFCPPYGGTALASSGYDLKAGTFQLTASGASECGGGAALAAHDTFTLVGPATATPLDFTVQLVIGATFSGGGLASAEGNATLREGVSNSQYQYFSPGNPTDVTFAVAVTRAVGATFDLAVESDVYALGLGSGATLAAHLNVTGLPAGYAVVSCQGYVSDPSVPVRRASWGRVKAIYR